MEGRERIGIDIGRVLMSATDAGGHVDTAFVSGGRDRALQTPPNAGALDTICQLVAKTNGAVWLVSKAPPHVERLTRDWLAHWNFHALTGLPEANVRFCLERIDKSTHARELHLSHFVDDRLDVHTHLRGVVPNLYLFGHQRARSPIPEWVKHVLTWADVRRELVSPNLANAGSSLNWARK